MTHMLIDLDAYFKRIGYGGPRNPSLATLNGILHAHVLSIAFENLDVICERKIDLDAASLQQKLIFNNRGGYCFEQNGFFLLVLEALGFDVLPISARVRIGKERDFIPARTHLFVRVTIEGDSWLADVGVGALTPTAAIRLELNVKQATPHEPRRIIQQGAVYYHQAYFDDEWNDVCDFTLEEMPLIDREVGNWYTSKHPQSHFRQRILVTRAAPAGERLTLVNNEFSIRDATGESNKRVITSKDAFILLLAEKFDLHIDPDDSKNLFAMLELT